MKRTMLMLLTVALLLSGVMAQAEVTQNQTMTTTVTLPNPCTLENVHFTVTMHFVNQVILTGNMAHVTTHVNMSGTGVGGTSEANYMINAADKFALNVGVGTDYTISQHVNVTGQGNVPNYKLDVTFRLRLDANGNVIAFTDNFATTCQ
jgi:hypothetical protein